MKKLLLIFALLFIFNKYSYSWDRLNTERMIEKADKFINYIDNSLQIRQYIPYDYYSESIINIRNSRKELENEEFDIAYFYATIAIIKLQTADVIARTRSLKAENITAERNYYKKNIDSNKGNKLLQSIIDARLHRKGNIYRIELLDKKIFFKRKLQLTAYGKSSIDKIINVLKNFQNSKIKIVGHASFNDLKKFSRFKSKFIVKYLIRNGINSNRMKYMGAGNNIVMDTPEGFRRIDRVEFILTGIKN